MKIIYIAGPMTGCDDHNFPAFMEAESRFEELGFRVINPAKLHPGFETTDDSKIADRERRNFMRTDLPAITFCDAIALLPGWWSPTSAAGIEASLAAYCGLEFYDGLTGESWGKLSMVGLRTRALTSRTKKSHVGELSEC